MSALLAERFHRQGHRVILVTQTPSGEPEHDDFEVVRRPSAARLFELVRGSDVVFHNNISLRLAWPLLVLRRPWVVAHHTWIPARGLAGRVKRLLLRHEEQRRTNALLAEQVRVLTQERDALKGRLNAARQRIERIVQCVLVVEIPVVAVERKTRGRDRHDPGVRSAFDHLIAISRGENDDLVPQLRPQSQVSGASFHFAGKPGSDR